MNKKKELEQMEDRINDSFFTDKDIKAHQENNPNGNMDYDKYFINS